GAAFGAVGIDAARGARSLRELPGRCVTVEDIDPVSGTYVRGRKVCSDLHSARAFQVTHIRTDSAGPGVAETSRGSGKLRQRSGCRVASKHDDLVAELHRHVDSFVVGRDAEHARVIDRHRSCASERSSGFDAALRQRLLHEARAGTGANRHAEDRRHGGKRTEIACWIPLRPYHEDLPLGHRWSRRHVLFLAKRCGRGEAYTDIARPVRSGVEAKLSVGISAGASRTVAGAMAVALSKAPLESPAQPSL